jgi:hypothetical protein
MIENGHKHHLPHKVTPLGFLIVVVVVVLLTGWLNDYQSCVRTHNTRVSLVTAYEAQVGRIEQLVTIDTGQRQALDRQAVIAYHKAITELGPEKCLAFFPPT